LKSTALALVIALWLVPLLSGPAAAEARAYSLSELEEIALKVNPALGVAAEDVARNEAELRIARQYPNPELDGWASSEKALEAVPAHSGIGYGVAAAQTVEWFGRRWKRQEAAGFGIEAAQGRLAGQRLDVLARVRELFYRELAAQRRLQIAEENLASARELLGLVEKRVRLGESREIELIKARVEFYTVEREYQRARTELAASRQVLSRFLLGSLPAEFSLAGDLSVLDPAVPLSGWQEAALSAQPQLAAQKAAIRQTEATLAAERQAWVPDLTFRVFRNEDIDLRSTGGGLTLSIPLWNRKGGEVARAAADRRRAEFELGLIRQQLETGVAAQYALYEVSRRQVETFQENLLKEAAESLRLAQFTYEQGEASLLDLLDSRRVWRATQQDYYGALLDYWLARTELWRIAGGQIGE
jgi:cobalt-zinc-cadmium efflux system outer membrane protein